MRLFGRIAASSQFQYRKRYEITCDLDTKDYVYRKENRFQYRKRYEITCDLEEEFPEDRCFNVSIPQAV